MGYLDHLTNALSNEYRFAAKDLEQADERPANTHH